MIGYDVGFTGTQKGWSHDQEQSVIAVFKTLRAVGCLWLHEGDCVGADEAANKLWRELGGKVHQHPPSSSKLQAFQPSDVKEPSKPYLQRNRDIVASSNILVATPKSRTEELRSGTWSTIRYARQAKINRIIIFPSGEIITEMS